MKTSEQQTLPFGEDASMSSPEAFRASRSASQAKGKARKTNATSGRKCSGLFGLFDPVGSWARMFSELLIGRKEWSSSRCALTWKRRDMRYNRTLYQLAVSALPINDTECGLLPTALLPTPIASDATTGAIIGKEDVFVAVPGALPRKVNRNGTDGSLGLARLVKLMDVGLLPTPIAGDWKGQRRSDGTANMLSGVVALAANALLPTPNASEGEKYTTKYNPDSQMGRGLTAMAVNGMLPTPKANDFRSGMQNRVGTEHTQQLNDTIAFQTGKTSQLNPQFVCEMMGFPAGWTTKPFLLDESQDSHIFLSPNSEGKASKPTEMP